MCRLVGDQTVDWTVIQQRPGYAAERPATGCCHSCLIGSGLRRHAPMLCSSASAVSACPASRICERAFTPCFTRKRKTSAALSRASTRSPPLSMPPKLAVRRSENGIESTTARRLRANPSTRRECFRQSSADIHPRRKRTGRPVEIINSPGSMVRWRFFPELPGGPTTSKSAARA